MAQTFFHRVEMSVTIRRTEDGGALARVVSPSATTETRLSDETVRDWLKLRSGAQLTSLARLLFLTRDSPTWDGLANTLIPSYPGSHRLTFDVNDPELAALAWERSLFPSIPSDIANRLIIARISPVIPRVTTVALTLPLRFLQVKLSPQRASLPDLIRKSVGTSVSDSLAAQAVQVDTCKFSDLTNWQLGSEWPTTEVLHFDRFPTLDTPKDILLSTSEPERSGTLGWLARLADTLQTRLIVIHCNDQSQVAQARRLATALLDRGGPAVLVEHFSAPVARTFYAMFYDNIIHDMPLDFSLSDAALRLYFGAKASVVGVISKCSLFVGTGRSEALRISALSEGLVRLADDLARPTTDESQRARLEIRQMLERLNLDRPLPVDPDIVLDDLQEGLSHLRYDLAKLVYDYSERQGLLPLTEMLGQTRDQAKSAGAVSFGLLGASDAAPTPGPRYVNSHLWSRANGELTRLEQKMARLTVGNTYYLGVQIGPQDEFVRVYGAAALLEEIFKWTPDMSGVWLEVGLTGLDFEIIGDPVQEIWLPRENASETIYFTVVPQTQQVACLRLCLYYKSDLIQSFRLAALTRSSQEEDLPPEMRTERLARALDLPAAAVGDVGYLARLEYSVTANLVTISDRPARRVSIVANDNNGRSVITVKGPNHFEAGIRTNDDLSVWVEGIRAALDRISKRPVDDVDPDLWPYGFGRYGESPNVGDDDKLKTALTELASLGWEFYNDIVRGSGHKILTEALKPEQQIIQVAHILLEKVIPWAVLYDHNYDPTASDNEDNPYAHDVCLAALPDKNGVLPEKGCEEHPDCLLHPDHCADRRARGEPTLLPETVVCPLHFWGFKHIIELPIQRAITRPADGQQKAKPQGHELRTCILSQTPARMTTGIHAGLPLAKEHKDKLNALVKKPAINAEWKSHDSHRRRILNNLNDPTLDLIYFYCHARDQHPAGRPYLEFEDQQKRSGKITAANLGYDPKWTHHPLVFLNGCRTAGFSPKALSPFLEKLVDDREAAGVIGTEISVWEPLADEMALFFLEKFLAGHSAGEALLFARRALLAQHNPLGLVYTLYAAADLRLDVDGDGKCPPAEDLKSLQDSAD